MTKLSIWSFGIRAIFDGPAFPRAFFLLNYSFFREKKFNGNRLYFLIYEEWNAILMVSVGVKKIQPETIAMTKENLEMYRQFVYTELKKDGLI